MRTQAQQPRVATVAPPAPKTVNVRQLIAILRSVPRGAVAVTLTASHNRLTLQAGVRRFTLQSPAARADQVPTKPAPP